MFHTLLLWFLFISEVYFVTCDLPIIEYYTANETDLLTKVLYVNEELYVGGKNVLLNLDPDFVLYEKTQIGPVKDHKDCVAEPEPCDFERELSDNEVKVLLPYAEVLLVCGSVNQGICHLRQQQNITSSLRVGDPRNVTNFVGGKSTVVAFFSDKKLYTAHSYDGRHPDLSSFFASSRVVSKNTSREPCLAYTYADDQTVSGVDYYNDNIKLKYRSYYIYGFSHKNYNYFVSYEPVGLKTLDYETRISRVCGNDNTFTSYSEIALKCFTSAEVNYNMATAAVFTNATDSQKYKKRETEPRDFSLYITFARGDDKTIPNDDNGTIMCRYGMSKIVNAFEEEVKKCFRGDHHSSRIAKIHGPGAMCTRTDAKVKR